MTEFEEIKALSGNTESACSCSTCQNMCKTSPCIGTPDDILRLINNGYVGKISASIYMVGVFYFNARNPVHFATPTRLDDGSCIFFNNGLCDLHESGLKPTEGKLVNHETTGDYKTSSNYLVSETWNKPENAGKVKKIFKAIVTYAKARKG